jgi:hypothetical protein
VFVNLYFPVKPTEKGLTDADIFKKKKPLIASYYLHAEINVLKKIVTLIVVRNHRSKKVKKGQKTKYHTEN